MEGKKLRVLTEILAIIAIVLVSFVGVYKQDANMMKNQVKEYIMGKDLLGYRELVFKVSDAVQVVDTEGKVMGNTDRYSDEDIVSYSYLKTENKINADENLTMENYKKSKKIIETRLKDLQIEDYNLSLNEEDGTISLQIPEDNNTDHVVSNILQVADFKVKDSEDDSKVFLTNSDLKNVQAMYNNTSTGAIVYLDIELNENGKKILKDLSSNEYVTKPEEETEDEESSENQEDENAVEAEAEVSTEEQSETEENTDENSEESSEESEEEKQKEVILSIDDNEMITTSFDEPIEDGVITLSMSRASTDSEEITSSLQSTSTIALLLESGPMPLTYKITTNQYIDDNASQNTLQKVLYGIGAIFAIVLVYLIVKYKLRGLIAVISFIGFLAIDLLIVRYTNISIGYESVVATVIVLIINYLLVYNLLKIQETDVETKKIVYNKEITSWIANLMPIFITSIVFVFIKWSTISLFGMFIFWGVLVSIIYNALITRDMLS